MTEALGDTAPKYAGEAILRVRPGPELSQALERFMTSDYVLRLGGRALELRSESRLAVFDRLSESDRHDGLGVSKAKLLSMSVRLDERQAQKKPTIAPTVKIVSYPPPDESENEGPGIDMRFGVVMDELTARILADTVLIDRPNEAYVHLLIRRPNMRLGFGLNDSRDNLLELLRRRPQPVESISISSNAIKP